MLLDFDSRFPNRDLAMHAYKQPSSTGDRTMPAKGLVLGGPVAIARVNHGRWIADCPCDGCGGAEYVSLSERHAFFCCECRNAPTGHVPIPVVLPDVKTREQVTAYLCVRPGPASRNWSPDEPVRQLLLENRQHGLKLR